MAYECVTNKNWGIIRFTAWVCNWLDFGKRRWYTAFHPRDTGWCECRTGQRNKEWSVGFKFYILCNAKKHFKEGVQTLRAVLWCVKWKSKNIYCQPPQMYISIHSSKWFPLIMLGMFLQLERSPPVVKSVIWAWNGKTHNF